MPVVVLAALKSGDPKTCFPEFAHPDTAATRLKPAFHDKARFIVVSRLEPVYLRMLVRIESCCILKSDYTKVFARKVSIPACSRRIAFRRPSAGDAGVGGLRS